MTINIHNNDDIRGAEPWVPEGKEDALRDEPRHPTAGLTAELCTSYHNFKDLRSKTERLTRKETIEREPEIFQHTSLSNSQNAKNKRQIKTAETRRPAQFTTNH